MTKTRTREHTREQERGEKRLALSIHTLLCVRLGQESRLDSSLVDPQPVTEIEVRAWLWKIANSPTQGYEPNATLSNDDSSV